MGVSNRFTRVPITSIINLYGNLQKFNKRKATKSTDFMRTEVRITTLGKGSYQPKHWQK